MTGSKSLSSASPRTALVSTATTASRGRSRRTIRLGGRQVSADAALALALAAALVLLAFVTKGGDELAPNTWAEIALTLIGAGIAVAVLLVGVRRPAWGGIAVALFAVLAALTAASISWSVAPDRSWVEAGRTLSYLAVFGGGVALARLGPGRWPALVGAIGMASTAIGAYALFVKVFPGTFDATDTVGRLQVPFDYWNATGLIAALGLAPCVWAGARPVRGRWLRAVAIPAISILLTVLVLSYSRGALAAAVIGLALWFATVPLRLRGALVLALGAVGATVLTVFAISDHALTGNQVALPARITAGHWFGAVLVVVLALMIVAGVYAMKAMDRTELSDRVRRRVGASLLIAVGLVPVAAVAALAASSRGLTGEVSHLASALTSTHSGAANTPGRIFELGNTRGRYWSEGLKVGEHALLKGAGALGYQTAATRYTTDAMVVPHAHSFVIQTFADFGLIGIAVILALLIAWALAAGRTLRAVRTRDRPEERAGLLTMLAVVITFGAHSAIDWTWFVPGTAVPALLCAGWLAGRGPATRGVGRVPRRRRLAESPGLGAAVVAIAAATLLCAWAVWQPLRSQDATAAAITALGNGDIGAAIADARNAAAEEPVAVEPLLELAAIYTASGNLPAARHELVRAVNRQPENAQTWLALGEFDLQHHHRARALASLRRAQLLDLGSPAVSQALAQAERAGPSR